MTILTVTVNPALDLTTDVEQVESGTKLRCGEAHCSPGGGGVNVSRAIRKLGGRSLAFIATGGVTGQLFRSLLEAEGVDARWFETSGLTRQSIIVDERASGRQFRFVLPGPNWTGAEAEAAVEAIADALAEGPPRIGYIVASGSLPPGVPDDFFQAIGEIGERTGARLILDTSGRMLEAAGQGGRFRPYAWIMDQGEAEHLAGGPLPDLDALDRFGQDLRARDLAQILILTFAEGGAVVLSDTESFRLIPPEVEVASKVGAGDSFVAGLTLKLDAGAPLREACAYAVAAATSAVTTPAAELCDGPGTERYFKIILDQNAWPRQGSRHG